MNKILYYSIITLLLASCSKRDEVGTPDFEVTANGSTFKMGDSIIFNFKGNPQNIVFWPGTAGRVYEYRNRTFSTGNKLMMRFTTFQSWGPKNNFQVLVSSNFKGVYDAAGINGATWTDITDRVTLSQGLDNVPSGTVDLSEFTTDNRSATIAFRYLNTTLQAQQNRWVVRTFNMENVEPDGTTTLLANMASGAWKAVSMETPTGTSWVITSAQLLMVGSPTAMDEDWVLSKTFNPNIATPDKGIPIKNITTNLTRYVAALDLYNKPGTYKVIFEASNASYENVPERTVKEITITITP
ncbi:MAG: DUF5017 domain-containing protein [Pseudobacter sp.]|uniref:DUF5017 domain-containing protein n=1 Tax=Pseudobacter sp. TaxID=2045420 RepID=UPI003F81075E